MLRNGTYVFARVRPFRRYAFGLLFKVRGFTVESTSGAGTATTAGDSQPAVFDGLGLLLVAMCCSFLLWGAVLVFASLWRQAFRLFRARGKGLSAADKDRLEVRRRVRLRRLNREQQRGTARPGAGAVRLHSVVRGDHVNGDGAKQRALADVGASSTWHDNPMQAKPDGEASPTPLSGPSRVAFGAARSRAPDRNATLAKLKALSRVSPRARGRHAGRAQRGRRRSRGRVTRAKEVAVTATEHSADTEAQPTSSSRATTDQLARLRALRASRSS